MPPAAASWVALSYVGVRSLRFRLTFGIWPTACILSGLMLTGTHAVRSWSCRSKAFGTRSHFRGRRWVMSRVTYAEAGFGPLPPWQALIVPARTAAPTQGSQMQPTVILAVDLSSASAPGREPKPQGETSNQGYRQADREPDEQGEGEAQGLRLGLRGFEAEPLRGGELALGSCGPSDCEA